MANQAHNVEALTQLIETGVRDQLRHIVFEPNSPALWRKISDEIGAFLQDLFTQGKFRGRSKKDAYFVNCGAGTTTQSDMDQGIVNIVIGFAALQPAEFVVITIQQMVQSVEGSIGCKS